MLPPAPRGIPIKTVTVLAVGGLASLGLVGFFGAFILAPVERDVLLVATVAFGFIATMVTAMLNIARADDAVVEAQAVASTVNDVKASMDVVHTLVNSRAAQAQETQAAERAAATEATRVAASAATAATLLATQLSTEALREMVAMAVTAAMATMLASPPPASPPAPSAAPDPETKGA